MKRVVLLGVLVALVGCGDTTGRVNQVVDELENSGQLATYCKATAQADEFGFTEDEAFEHFRRGYQSDDPPPRDVFEEIRSRC